MLRCREMINLFSNAEEIDAGFILRYEGWTFGSEDSNNPKFIPENDPELVQRLGYHEVVRWEILTMDISDAIERKGRDPKKENSIATMIILVVSRDEPEDEPPANPPLRKDVLDKFDMASTIEDSDAVKVELRSIDNAYDFVESIEIIRNDCEKFIDPRTNEPTHGVTLTIQVCNCETGVIFDWAPFNRAFDLE